MDMSVVPRRMLFKAWRRCLVANTTSPYLKIYKPPCMYNRNTMYRLIFMGYQFSWFSWRVRSTTSSTHEIAIVCINYEKSMAMKFELHKCVNFVKSTKIGTHENKAIHSIINHDVNNSYSTYRSTNHGLAADGIARQLRPHHGCVLRLRHYWSKVHAKQETTGTQIGVANLQLHYGLPGLLHCN